MDRIKIDLLDWECACCAICTKNVDLDIAEKQLYTQMRMKYGYDDNDIANFINDAGDNNAREKFLSHLCEEEELAIIRNGGVYYEDIEEFD